MQCRSSISTARILKYAEHLDYYAALSAFLSHRSRLYNSVQNQPGYVECKRISSSLRPPSCFALRRDSLRFAAPSSRQAASLPSRSSQSVGWWLGGGSNTRPRDYDSPALPLSYRATRGPHHNQIRAAVKRAAANRSPNAVRKRNGAVLLRRKARWQRPRPGSAKPHPPYNAR